jgi:hypothetical protein
MLQFAGLSTSSADTMEYNIKVLMIDTRDLTLFYQQMNNVTIVKGIHESANKESKERCDFGMHSSLIRQLEYSSDVYRKLTLGKV